MPGSQFKWSRGFPYQWSSEVYDKFTVLDAIVFDLINGQNIFEEGGEWVTEFHPHGGATVTTHYQSGGAAFAAIGLLYPNMTPNDEVVGITSSGVDGRWRYVKKV